VLSLTRQLRHHPDNVRIIVVDGSKRPGNESLNRSMVKAIAVSTRREIAFIGRRERLKIRTSVRSVCSGDVVDFITTPGASGNRNTAILLSSGENILLVDDDVVCELWRLPSFRNTIDVCGHFERRRIEFFKTRVSARRGMARVTTSLLDAHGLLLGRSLESLGASTSPSVDVRRACRFLVEGLAGLRNVVVRTTFSGLTGDAGASNPERLLFATGKWKELLLSSRDVYDTAFKYREVRRVADRYLVAHDMACMGFCMGLANSSMPPPFLPTGRNEDGLFGLTLAAVDRSAVVGHVPYAVLHDSARASRYGPYAFVSATQTRLADLMIHLVNSWKPSTKSLRPALRLSRLAQWFAELADLDERDLARTIVETVFAVRERELSLIAGALRLESDYPEHWQRDLKRYRDTLLANLRRPEFFLPVELNSDQSIGRRYRAVRQFLRMSSASLVAWPTLWEEARRRTRVA
jgi:glycosyltransferase involved in cell wall biosynthesis